MHSCAEKANATMCNHLRLSMFMDCCHHSKNERQERKEDDRQSWAMSVAKEVRYCNVEGGAKTSSEHDA